MTKTLMTIAFATVSMFAAQTPAAPAPAAATQPKPAVVKPVKKHQKVSKKAVAKPVAKTAVPAPAPVSK